jgi:hypothetical protein
VRTTKRAETTDMRVVAGKGKWWCAGDEAGDERTKKKGGRNARQSTVPK